MVECLMYLVKNLLNQFAVYMLYVFERIDLVDFFLYVMLISGILLVAYVINRCLRRFKV